MHHAAQATAQPTARETAPDPSTGRHDPRLHGFEIMEAGWGPTLIRKKGSRVLPSPLGAGLGIGVATVALQVVVLFMEAGFARGSLWALAIGAATAFAHQAVHVRRAARLRAAEGRATATLDLPGATARVFAALCSLPPPHGMDQAMVHLTWQATEDGMRCSYGWIRSPHGPVPQAGAPFHKILAASKPQPLDLDSLPTVQRLLPWTAAQAPDKALLVQAESSWSAGVRFPRVTSAHQHMHALAMLPEALRWGAKERAHAARG